jgi:hypothetical protein
MATPSDKTGSKKPKLVRDSFTIPKNEFAAIDALKARAIALGTSVKKSELLRAGLMALQGLSDAAYKAALSAVPTLKTGRPASTAAEQPVKAAAAKKKSPAKPTPEKKASANGKAAARKPATQKPAARKPAPAKAAARKPAARKPAA